MAKDEPIFGAHGIGKWDATSTRYIPIGGGSRSRLALSIKNIPPYEGFAGLDRRAANEIDNMASLFEWIGGGAADTDFNQTRRSEQNREPEASSEPIDDPVYSGTPIQMPVGEAPPVQEPVEASRPDREPVETSEPAPKPEPLSPLPEKPEHLGALTEELAQLREQAPEPEPASEPEPEPAIEPEPKSARGPEPEPEPWGEPIMDSDGFL